MHEQSEIRKKAAILLERIDKMTLYCEQLGRRDSSEYVYSCKISFDTGEGLYPDKYIDELLPEHKNHIKAIAIGELRVYNERIHNENENHNHPNARISGVSWNWEGMLLLDENGAIWVSSDGFTYKCTGSFGEFLVFHPQDHLEKNYLVKYCFDTKEFLN